MDAAPIKQFSRGAVVFDGLFAVALLIGTYFGAKRLSAWRWQFSIRTALLCIAVVAAVLAFRETLLGKHYVLQVAALVVVLIGVVLNVVGAVSWLRLQKLLNRFSEK